MENYYQEILEEIQQNLNDGNIDEAMYLIRKEKSMPYIPIEIENQLDSYWKECVFQMNEKKKVGEESIDDLLLDLYGNGQAQLSAASKLIDRNIRSHVNEIQEWMRKDPLPEALALVIEAIAEQEVDETFEITLNGMEYTFDGDSVIPITKSEGFQIALQLIYSWLSSNPSLVEMCKTILVHKAYMYLPLSYEKEEAVNLALEVCDEVCDLMDDAHTKDEVHQSAQMYLDKLKTLN